MTKTYAYMRISTNKQEVDRQELQIEKYAEDKGYEIDEWFSDVISGKITNKPSWELMKSKLNKRDRIIVVDFDRIGRDWEDIIEQYRWLVDNEMNLDVINFELLNINSDTLETVLENKLVKRLFIEIACYSAEKERLNTSRRTKEGMAVARAKGKQIGRRQTLDHAVIDEAIQFYLDSDYPVRVIAKKFKIAQGTLASYIHRAGYKAQHRNAEPKHKYKQ